MDNSRVVPMEMYTDLLARAARAEEERDQACHEARIWREKCAINEMRHQSLMSGHPALNILVPGVLLGH